MAYSKQNFKDGQTLTAAMLNNIEAGIVQNEENLKNIQLTPGPQGPQGEKGEPGTPADLTGYLTETEADSKYQPKGDYLTEHQPIKTINGQSLVGEGDITIEGGETTPSITYTDAECRAAFIEKMNEKAVEIGMTNTEFLDPTGRTNTSTAYDMARCLLHATGYEKMYDIWNTPERDIKCIKSDGTIRIQNAISSVVNSDYSNRLTNEYMVVGGKTGTLSTGPYYNLASVCQSNDNPMDLYAIAVMRANTINGSTGDRFIATKEVMDLIESGELDDAHIPDALDEIAYENLSYRDIFINNNDSPNINENSMVSKTGLSYKDNAGTTSIVTDANAATNYVPPYSAYVSGTTSQQACTIEKISIDTEYFLAANVNVTSYTKGYAGVIFGSNFDACANAVTDGYEVFSTIVTDTRVTSGRNDASLYIGSASSANLTAYINNPVAIKMSIFETAPTVDKLTEMYNAYTAKLIEMYESGSTDTGTSINPSASNICVFKVPYHNARALKNTALTPVYAKAATEEIMPASITKIMTSMLVMDYVTDLHEKVTLMQEDIDALTDTTRWYASDILLGESVTYDDLLYIMMLPSSNIATEMVSRAVGEKILRSNNL